MPVHKASKQGKSGFQYGTTGKIYIGPGAHLRAVKQAQAIHASQTRQSQMKTKGKH